MAGAPAPRCAGFGRDAKLGEAFARQHADRLERLLSVVYPEPLEELTAAGRRIAAQLLVGHLPVARKVTEAVSDASHDAIPYRFTRRARAVGHERSAHQRPSHRLPVSNDVDVPRVRVAVSLALEVESVL